MLGSALIMLVLWQQERVDYQYSKCTYTGSIGYVTIMHQGGCPGAINYNPETNTWTKAKSGIQGY